MTILDETTLTRWRANPISFITEALINPETGRPFELLEAEIEFLRQAFEITEDGRLKYPELIYAAIKKTGKTTFAAIFLLPMVLLFGGRFAEAYIVANDLEQAQSRVFEAVRRIVMASPLLRKEAKIGNDRIVFTALDATITALASHFESAAGAHPTISIFDELWAVTSERGYRLWDEMIPVPTRKISCRLVVTHAGFSGESTLLEELHKRGLAQPQVGKDLYAGDGQLTFWSHDPIAPWQTPQWIEQMQRTLRPAQFTRMIRNEWVTSETTFIDANSFDQCVDPNHRPAFGDPRSPVWVGVDASIKHDSTALVMVRFDHDHQRVVLLNHRIFQPTPQNPLDFEGCIEQTLLDWSRNFRIKHCLYDPWQMHSSAQRLARLGIPMREFPQTSDRLTESSQNLFELIRGRNLVLYPDAAIRLAAMRAIAIETPRGWRIGIDNLDRGWSTQGVDENRIQNSSSREVMLQAHLPGRRFARRRAVRSLATIAVKKGVRCL